MSESQNTAILVGDQNRNTIGDIVVDVMIEEPETNSNRIAINPVSKSFTGHIERKPNTTSVVASWFDVRHREGYLLTGYAAEQVEKVKAIMNTVVTLSTPSSVHTDVLIQDVITMPTRNHPGKKSVRIRFMKARFAGIKTRETSPAELAKYAASEKRKAAKKRSSKNATDSEDSKASGLFDGSVPLNIAKNAGWVK